MRFTRANIDSYGHFAGRSFEIDPKRIVVIHGPNEAGKTTFASFLTTMMFGFSPGNIDQHPYAQLRSNEKRLTGTLEFVSGDRRRCAIYRELKSTPKSRYTSGEGLFGDEEDLRNRPIPSVDHINRRVFKSVYSLSLSDMDEIESRTWDFIQDRLLGGLGMDYIKPARVVIESLEQEAKQFWRPDRRGKPVSSEIEQRLKQLRESRRKAREVDQRVRDLAVKIGELELSIDGLKKERAELKYRQRIINRARPVNTLRQRISELRSKAGDVSPYAELPADPIQELRELRDRKSELQERKLALESRIREDSATIDSYGDKQVALRTVEDEIRSWTSRVGRHESSVAELDETNAQISELSSRLQPVAESLFGSTDLKEILAQLNSVNQSALLSDIGLIADVESARTSDGEATARLKKGQTIALVVALAGLLCAVTGVVLANAFAIGAGLTSSILAVAFWLIVRPRSQASGDLRVEKQDVVNRINMQLGLLRIDSNRMRNGVPDSRLAPDMQRLCDGANEYVRLMSRHRRLSETVADDRQRLRVLTERLGTDNHAPPTVLIARMSRDLEDANFRYQSSEKARHRTDSVRTDLDRTDAAIEKLDRQESHMARLLEQCGDGDLRVGANSIISKRRAQIHADQLSETLDKDYPDWRDLLDQELSTRKFTEGEVVGTELRLDEVEEQLQAVASSLASAREQIRSLQDAKPASDIEGEIEVARKDLLSAKIERDRRMLIAAVLRRSEQKFRDQHQPDVIKKANEYLKIITSGRHNKLVLDDLTGSLRLWSEDEKRYLNVDQPLSRGTLDQIYLALRIAIVDHLDRNHEKLPVVMDEVLVNWDAGRRQRAYAILKKLSIDRHVLMFTCHQWMVDEITDVLDAQVITLG
ncbi:MAG: AAA family ATPase [Rhodothermales bacterium]|nr:AAA family ATPase [Rhodothermales bacterium]